MTSYVIRVGTWAVSERDLDLTATALKLAAESARRQERRDGVSLATEYDRLLRDATDAALAASAPQAAQVARDALAPQSIPTDLITVKEAADIMDCSESNVRQMTNRTPPTLWSTVHGGLKMVARDDVIAKRKRGA